MTAERKHNVGALKRTFFGLLTLASSEGVAQPPEPASGQPDVPKGELAYAGNRDGNWDIYVAASDGSGRKNLTNNPSDEFDPAFSPDGKEIAFTSNRASGDSFELYKMNSDGSRQERILAGGSNGLPAWTPDGRIILTREFVTLELDESTNGADIYVVNRDGSGLQRLGSEGFNLGTPIFHDFGPSASPDGRTIVFSSILHRHGINTFLATLPISGAAPEAFPNVLFNSKGNDDSPSWSPDGGWIAFSSDMGGERAIYKIKPDGSGLTKLVSLPEANLPSWDPSGRWIVFSAKEDGDFDLFAVPVEGGKAIKLFDTPHDEVDPSWSPQEAPQALGTERYEDTVRLLVLIPGANTPTVTDTFPTGETGAFIDITFEARRVGYNAKQWAIFSRNGGQLNEKGEWEPNPATCEDTGRSIEEQKQELHQMLLSLDEAYPNAQHILVGHSLGGVLAFEYAKDNPERIAGVIILSPPVDGLDKDLLRGVLNRIPFRSEKPCIVTIVDSPAIDKLQEWSQDPTRPRQNREAALRMLEQGITLVVAGNEDCDAVIAGLRECLLGIKSDNNKRQFLEIPWVDDKRRLGSDIDSGDTGHSRILQDRGEGGAVTEAFAKVPQLGFVPRTPQHWGK